MTDKKWDIDYTRHIVDIINKPSCHTYLKLLQPGNIFCNRNFGMDPNQISVITESTIYFNITMWNSLLEFLNHVRNTQEIHIHILKYH